MKKPTSKEPPSAVDRISTLEKQMTAVATAIAQYTQEQQKRWRWVEVVLSTVRTGFILMTAYSALLITILVVIAYKSIP